VSGPPSVVFLDRDGVINRKAPEGRYVRSWAEFEYLPGAIDAIAALGARGVATVVVTNQRGIARGHMTREDVEDIHRRMSSDFERAGAPLDAVFYCPHERGECDCRKPGLGMFHAAQRELGVDLRDAAMVGDSRSDMQAAAALGVPGVFVAPAGDPGPGDVPVAHRASSLQDAVAWLLRGG
jgi:D-glycero-D-manno-heptose 1,7-bisphosphate phosphatase